MPAVMVDQFETGLISTLVGVVVNKPCIFIPIRVNRKPARKLLRWLVQSLGMKLVAPQTHTNRICLPLSQAHISIL